MKKITQTLAIIILLMIGFNLMAQETIPDDAIDLSQGKIYIQSGGYSVGSSSGTLVSHSGAYNIYSSVDTAEYTTYIQSGAGEQDIAIWNTTTNYSYGFLTDKSNSDVILRFYGDNRTLGTKRAIGFYKVSSNHKMSIVGDSLTANGPIKDGNSGSANYISLEVSLSYLNIDLPSGGDAMGTNYYSFRKINISDSSIITCNGTIYADTIIIGKASVSAPSLSVPAINSSGDTVYCVTVVRSGSNTITVNDVTNNTSEDYAFTSAHPGDDNYYLYLPNGSYSFNNGDGYAYTATVDGAATTAILPPRTGDGIIDVSEGNIIIAEGEYSVNAQSYTYSGRNFIFSGTTTENTVTINGGADSVTFNNVDIQLSIGCPFKDASDTDLVVVLTGSNTLVSGSGFAAIQKDSITGMLTITGTDSDTLMATGGGTAIGAGAEADCANITIAGGVMTLKGGGTDIIGVSTYNYTAKNIFITGGKITATSTTIGLVIGSGIYNGTVENIVISGGVHNFYSYKGSYDSRVLPYGIKITGGTINAYQLANQSAFQSGIVTGGSLNPVTSDGTSISVNNQPVDNDSTTLYHAKYLVPDITEPTLINAITISDTTGWGCKDVYTDSTGLVHLWVPVADTVKVEIAVAGKTYTYRGQTVAYNNYVAPDEEEGIVEYGNYWWMVPVSIAVPENGTLSVTSSDSTLTDGDYFCYKTELPLSITATPETGYETNSITVYGEETTGDTTVVVSDTVKIAAAFSLQTFSLTQSITGEGTLTVSDGTNTYSSGSTVGYGTSLSILATPADSYKLDSIVVNSSVTTSSDTTITVTSDVSIAAYFRDVSGISEQELSKAKVYTSGHTLYVKAEAGTSVEVYSITGTKLTAVTAAGVLQQFDLPYKGVCLVKLTGSNRNKVVKCSIQ